MSLKFECTVLYENSSKVEIENNIASKPQKQPKTQEHGSRLLLREVFRIIIKNNSLYSSKAQDRHGLAFFVDKLSSLKHLIEGCFRPIAAPSTYLLLTLFLSFGYENSVHFFYRFLFNDRQLFLVVRENTK